jgi:hypothetical protein
LVEGRINMEYEYGVHCGDKDCHACGTQRYNCEELNRLDNKTALPRIPIGGNIDIDWEAL